MHTSRSMARAHCYTCDKVQSLCICDRVPSVDNRTGITILQDRREARHPFGTVRIARLGLSNVDVHVMRPGEARLDPPPGAALLFPTPGGPLLDELPVAERPTHLVAIDGTWGQASQLRRAHPELGALPTVGLAPAPSRYRIRKEPHPRAVSTLEAIVHALRILEPETRGLDELLSTFDAMIDDQLERRGDEPNTPRHRHTPREKKPLPEALTNDAAPVTLIYAELHQPRGQSRRFALRWTASRLGGAPLVDALVRSPLPPSPWRVANMGLGPDPFGDAVEPAEAAAMLRAFIRPDDTIVAWAQYPGPLLEALGFAQPFVSAKHVFANEHGGRLGRLGDVVGRLDGAPIAPFAEGRAGAELARLDRVVTAMRAGLVAEG